MRRVDLGATAAFVCGSLLIAGFASSFWLFLLTSAVVTATIAVSVGVIYDNAGLLSLCQMSFAGIGAWTVGWMNLNSDLPYAVMLVCAALVPLCVGVLVGIPALRLRGQNLAVFTLVFAAAVSHVVFADGFPGLIEGNRVRPPSIADSDAGFFLFCAAVLGLIGLAVTALRRSRTGRWWCSVRHSERATASMGRSVVLTKLSAFGVSAGIAGIGGALLVALNGVASGASFEPIQSMTILTAALMFGAGNFEGALLAGLFGRLIPNWLSDLGLPQDLAPMIFAVGGVLALSQGEGGLSAAVRAMVGKCRARHRSHRPASDTDAALIGECRSRTGLGMPGARAAAGGAAVLEIEHLSVSYGAVKPLQDVSLSIPPETLVGLIGPNGAGKSTLVDALSGFIADHEGRVVLDGHDITRMPPRKRTRLGMRRTFQQGRVPQALSVGGYLELAVTDRTSLAVSAALAHFSLPPADTPIATLDVGTRRILEVCGAALAAPKVALLDEPAAGLSGPDRERFVRAVADLPAASGMSIVLIEHDLDVVASLCERVVVLDFGRVIADGAPAEVLSEAGVVAAYLGAAP